MLLILLVVFFLQGKPIQVQGSGEIMPTNLSVQPVQNPVFIGVQPVDNPKLTN